MGKRQIVPHHAQSDGESAEGVNLEHITTLRDRDPRLNVCH